MNIVNKPELLLENNHLVEHILQINSDFTIFKRALHCRRKLGARIFLADKHDYIEYTGN